MIILNGSHQPIISIDMAAVRIKDLREEGTTILGITIGLMV